MTNINPENLIKDEPYLIKLDSETLIGFYKRYIPGNTDQLDQLEFSLREFDPHVVAHEECYNLRKYWLSDIKSLTHLKRGEVVK